MKVYKDNNLRKQKEGEKMKEHTLEAIFEKAGDLQNRLLSEGFAPSAIHLIACVMTSTMCGYIAHDVSKSLEKLGGISNAK